MKLRLALDSDYTACKNICEQFSEGVIHMDTFTELVMCQSIIVAEEKNHVCGLIAYRKLWDESMFLQFLRIDSDSHRRGIATLLLQEVENIALSHEYEELISTVLYSNIPSIELHKKLGFIQKWDINFSSGKEIVFVKDL